MDCSYNSAEKENQENYEWINKANSAEELLRMLFSYDEDSKKEIIIKWNRELEKVFVTLLERILRGEYVELSRNDQLKIDGYGLSLFHYAIIFGNQFMIAALKSNSDVPRMNGISDEHKDLFDPLLVAYLCNKTLFERLIEKEPAYQAMLSNYKIASKALDSFLTVDGVVTGIQGFIKKSIPKFEHVLDLQIKNKRIERDLARDAIKKRKSIDYAKYSSLDDELNNLNGLKESIHNSDPKSLYDSTNLKRELEEEVSNAYEELKEYKKSIHRKYEGIKKSYEQTDDPLIKMITFLYTNGKTEWKTYHALERKKIIWELDESIFLVDQDLFARFFRTTHQGGHNKTEKKRARKAEKPYGSHWFSDRAYRDIAQMKFEYRKLVKIYHPDGEDGEASIFIEIQNEKNEILRNLLNA